MGKLTVSAVKAATRPSRHADGAILYLDVKRSGAKSWVQRVVVDGRRHDLGLVPYPAVSLAKARRRAADNCALIADGGNPLARKRMAKVSTFREAAPLVHEANVERWKTGRHTDWWLEVVENAVPAFGEKAIDRIGREDVLGALVPIWTTKPEYARKLRQRLRIILDWAVAHGYVSQNFAGDAIRGALPAMPAVKEHHRTLHYAEIGSAIEAIENCRASKSVKLLWAVPRPNRGPKRRGPAGHVEPN